MHQYGQIAIEALTPYERNARTHSDEQVEKIAKSIREFGFLNPVLIDHKNMIVAGHGRVMAAKKLGLKEVPCVRIEGLTDTQIRAYILADNKLAEDAGWDTELLNLELKELADMDFDISLTGFEFTEPEVDIKAEKTEEEDEFDDVEKMEKHYGVPYQGNKSRIADIIIKILPAGKRLVDLFGGGGCNYTLRHVLRQMGKSVI